jgi:pyridoxal phosphate phosphatase PHOSPHO2
MSLLNGIKNNPRIKTRLAVFDFDNTLINVNSDTYINKLVESKIVAANFTDDTSLKKFKYPSEIEDLYAKFNWTHRMNGVFEYMKREHDIGKNDIINCVGEIRLDDSMIEVIKTLKSHDYELLILSDANTVFIDTILERHGLRSAFSQVYTNAGDFDSTGKLVVKPFNETFNADAALFNCSTGICASNICKGAVLKDRLCNETDPSTRSVFYFGDGHNDYCPGLCLTTENDVFFVRENFSLAKLLDRESELKAKLTSRVSFWKDAQDILQSLK